LLNPDDSPTLDTRIEVTITRNADLLKRIWLQINPTLIYPTSLNTVKLTTIANDFCHALFREIQLTIGGQVIDKLYGVWLSIWRDLNEYNPYGSIGAIETTGRRIPTQSSSQYNRMAYTNAGISSVPSIILNDQYLLQGAQPAESFVNAFEQLIQKS
jgi:hypothetical protein